jgi:hypothetical protein
VQLPAHQRQRTCGPDRKPNRSRSEDLPKTLRIEHRLGGEVERALDLVDQREPVGLCHVVRVHRLEASPAMSCTTGNGEGPQQRVH